MFLNDLIIAIPTPYDKGEVDLVALANIAQAAIASGYTRVLIFGSTGDQHMLSLDEKKAIVTYMHKNHPKLPVMYGVSGTSTEQAKALIDFVTQVDKTLPLMLSIPPYALPNQTEVMEYANTVLENVQAPVLFYNNERRTGVNVSAYTINCLMKKWPVIKAVKEAGSNQNIDFVTPYVYTGFDALMIEPSYYNVTTVMGNITPKTALYFMHKRKSENHAEIQTRYQALIDALVPIGLVKVSKYFYLQRGVIQSAETRRPMQELTVEEKQVVEGLLEEITKLEAFVIL